MNNNQSNNNKIDCSREFFFTDRTNGILNGNKSTIYLLFFSKKNKKMTMKDLHTVGDLS